MAILLSTSCEGGTEDTGDLCNHTPELDYDNFGAGFLGQFCNGCHSSIVPPDHRNGAPVGVNFDTYTDSMQWSERILARTINVEDPALAMPPGGGPTDDERGRLTEWIECSVKPDYLQFLEAQ